MKSIRVLLLTAIIMLVQVAHLKSMQTQPTPQVDVVATPILRVYEDEHSLYTHILSRVKKLYPVSRYGGDRSTLAHESTHFINGEAEGRLMRRMLADNDHKAGINYIRNCFFVPHLGCVYFPEPKLKKHQILKYIPPNLRQSRCKLYVQESLDWNDRPLYIMDEFSAYLNGGEVLIEDYQNGLEYTKTMGDVSGSLELSVYSVALALAIQDLDPAYFKENPSFLTFLEYQLDRAHTIFLQGDHIMKISYNTDEYRQRFIENKTMSAFLNTHCNGVWVRRTSKN